MIKIHKTVYDKPSREDGTRILVMRFWPRGVGKERVDEWLQDLGASPTLIRDWKNGKILWSEFKRRYTQELESGARRAVLKKLAERSKKEIMTLLCSCKEPDRCHRSVIKELVEKL